MGMAKPLLCVTVAAATTAELRARRDAVADADLVELRLDTVRDPSVPAALAGRRLPVVVTCRPKSEGGRFEGSEEERRALLADALTRGADYVDIEWRAGFDDLLHASAGRRIVLSMHDFSGVPPDLTDRVRAMRATGAQVVKVAVQAHRLADCLPLLEVGRAAGAHASTALVAMGDAGFPTRVLAAHFGSCWAYAGEQAGVGQVTAARLLNEFGFRRISTRTDIYGVAGSPLTHSVSPAMHNAAFRALHADAVHVPMQAADVADFMTFAGALNVKGVSVTAPFKVAVFERVDEADAVGRRVGAINTLRFADGRWLGANTDVAGFLVPLQGRLPLRDLRAAILGAGGAARAVTVALASVGARVSVYARRADRAMAVALLAGGQGFTGLPPPGSWDLLVNATPVGTYPNLMDTPYDGGLFDGRLVYDLVYNPPFTQLLREASAAGCAVVGGLDMLVAQAQLQLDWWLGQRPPDRVVLDAALARLVEFQNDHEQARRS